MNAAVRCCTLHALNVCARHLRHLPMVPTLEILSTAQLSATTVSLADLWPSWDFLWTSYGLTMGFLWTSCECLPVRTSHCVGHEFGKASCEKLVCTRGILSL